MSYILVDLYAGQTKDTFDTEEDLIAYLKKEKTENLGGEGRYAIYKGTELNTIPFWRKAFGKSVYDS